MTSCFIHKALAQDQRLLVDVKAADQTVNNSVVLVADADISIPVLAGRVYQFHLTVYGITPAAADWRLHFTYPAGSTGNYLYTGQTGTNYSYVISDTPTPGGAGTAETLEFHGTLIAAIDGNFSFEWAQATATVGDTTMRAGTSLVLVMVN